MPHSKKHSGVFSAEEICHIIEACSLNGVTEFILGELEIRFAGGHTTKPSQPIPAALPVGTPAPATAPVEPREPDLSEQLVEQMIMDPLAYENAMMEEALKDGEQ